MDNYETMLKLIVANNKSKFTPVKNCEQAFLPFNLWISEIGASNEKNHAHALLSGALSASVEVVSCAYLGLLRQAIFSLRGYYELAVAWLYYKDHAIEWKKISYKGESFQLPGETRKYLKQYCSDFETRLALLNKCKVRSTEDPYGILSNFVHGNVLETVPFATKPADLVIADQYISQAPKFIAEVCEFLVDVYVSAHSSNWESIPSEIRNNLEHRLTGSKKVLNFY